MIGWWRRYVVAWRRDVRLRLAIRRHVRMCYCRPCPCLPWARQLSWPNWKTTRSERRGELLGLDYYLKHDEQRLRKARA